MKIWKVLRQSKFSTSTHLLTQELCTLIKESGMSWKTQHMSRTVLRNAFLWNTQICIEHKLTLHKITLKWEQSSTCVCSPSSSISNEDLPPSSEEKCWNSELLCKTQQQEIWHKIFSKNYQSKGDEGLASHKSCVEHQSGEKSKWKQKFSLYKVSEQI